jgi:putative Holliday junction resolvase
MTNGTVVGLDFGRARVGVAVSDELGLLAHPRAPLDGKNPKQLLRALGELARAEGAVRFVVGLPLEMSGQSGPAARRVAHFCAQLAENTGLEVELVDERLTSVQATRQLAASGTRRRRIAAKVDSESAAIMLQQWLDAHRDPGERG